MIPMSSRGTRSFRRERLNHAGSGGRMKAYDRHAVSFDAEYYACEVVRTGRTQ